MKRLIYAIVLMLIPLSLMAQGINEPTVHNQNKVLKNLIPDNPQNLKLELGKKQTNKTQAVQYTPAYREIDAIFSLYYDVTPIHYDPVSGVITAVQCWRQRENQGDPLEGLVVLNFTSDMGQNWSNDIVYQQAGSIPVNPTIAALNPLGSNDPNKFNYLVQCRYFEQVGEEYPYTGGFFLFRSNSGSSPDSLDIVMNPSVDEQLWSNTRSAYYQGAEEGYIYNAGTLTPYSDNFQYGYYGFSGIYYLNDGSFDLTYNSIPTAWDVESLFPSTGQKTSSYQGAMNIDVDPEGKVYAIVNNPFMPNDIDRVPGFSTSTDNGQTWTDFEVMPETVLHNYITDNGGTVAPGEVYPLGGNLPYQVQGFTVTGVDQFSYVYRIYVWRDIGGGDFEGTAHVVECRYDQGSWSMSKVGEFLGINHWVVQDTSEVTGVVYDKLSVDNPRGSELQTAITADGEYLIAKWVGWSDMDEGYMVFDPPFQFANGTVDTLLTTDVYFAYRKLDGGEWTYRNVTEDLDFNRDTYIPSVVPSLNSIPMISLMPEAQQNPPRSTYPPFIQSLLIDATQNVMFSEINLNANPVEPRENTYGITLHDVYPNPSAGGIVEVPFELDKTADVRIELFNALGEKIADIFDGYAQPGFQAVTYDTGMLSAGTYYVTMTINNVRQTKLMNVVR